MLRKETEGRARPLALTCTLVLAFVCSTAAVSLDSSTPPNEEKGVAPSTRAIELVFTGSVTTSTGTLSIWRLYTPQGLDVKDSETAELTISCSDTSRVTVSGSTVTISWSDADLELEEFTVYYVTMDSTCLNEFGGMTEEDFEFRTDLDALFTTGFGIDLFIVVLSYVMSGIIVLTYVGNLISGVMSRAIVSTDLAQFPMGAPLLDVAGDLMRQLQFLCMMMGTSTNLSNSYSLVIRSLRWAMIQVPLSSVRLDEFHSGITVGRRLMGVSEFSLFNMTHEMSMVSGILATAGLMMISMVIKPFITLLIVSGNCIAARDIRNRRTDHMEAFIKFPRLELEIFLVAAPGLVFSSCFNLIGSDLTTFCVAVLTFFFASALSIGIQVTIPLKFVYLKRFFKYENRTIPMTIEQFKRIYKTKPTPGKSVTTWYMSLSKVFQSAGTWSGPAEELSRLGPIVMDYNFRGVMTGAIRTGCRIWMSVIMGVLYNYVPDYGVILCLGPAVLVESIATSILWPYVNRVRNVTNVWINICNILFVLFLLVLSIYEEVGAPVDYWRAMNFIIMVTACLSVIPSCFHSLWRLSEIWISLGISSFNWFFWTIEFVKKHNKGLVALNRKLEKKFKKKKKNADGEVVEDEEAPTLHLEIPQDDVSLQIPLQIVIDLTKNMKKISKAKTYLKRPKVAPVDVMLTLQHVSPEELSETEQGLLLQEIQTAVGYGDEVIHIKEITKNESTGWAEFVIQIFEHNFMTSFAIGWQITLLNDAEKLPLRYPVFSADILSGDQMVPLVYTLRDEDAYMDELSNFEDISAEFLTLVACHRVSDCKVLGVRKVYNPFANRAVNVFLVCHEAVAVRFELGRICEFLNINSLSDSWCDILKVKQGFDTSVSKRRGDAPGKENSPFDEIQAMQEQFLQEQKDRKAALEAANRENKRRKKKKVVEDDPSTYQPTGVIKPTQTAKQIKMELEYHAEKKRVIAEKKLEKKQKVEEIAEAEEAPAWMGHWEEAEFGIPSAIKMKERKTRFNKSKFGVAQADTGTTWHKVDHVKTAGNFVSKFVDIDAVDVETGEPE